MRNGGILKVLVVQNCTAKNLNSIKVGNTFLAAENSATLYNEKTCILWSTQVYITLFPTVKRGQLLVNRFSAIFSVFGLNGKSRNPL